MTPLIERLSEVAYEVLDETRCSVEWTETRSVGTAHPATRRVTSPPLDGPDPIYSMTTFLHEVGHVVAPRDHPVGEWRRENAASTWALFAWRQFDLPEFERAEYLVGDWLGGYVRKAISEGRATIAEVREAVPDGVLKYVGELREPQFISEMNERQLRRAVKSGHCFPDGMSHAERLSMIGRLQDWAA